MSADHPAADPATAGLRVVLDPDDREQVGPLARASHDRIHKAGDFDALSQMSQDVLTELMQAALRSLAAEPAAQPTYDMSPGAFIESVESEPTAQGRTSLSHEQREAMERSLGGGLAGYVQRIRRDHGPRFTGNTYTGCRCGDVGCGKALLVVHMDDLVRAYELKVADFAAETARVADLLSTAQVDMAVIAEVLAEHELRSWSCTCMNWTFQPQNQNYGGPLIRAEHRAHVAAAVAARLSKVGGPQ